MKNRRRSQFLARRYSNKQDGVLRAYDMRSRGNRAWAIVIFVVCLAMIAIVLFPVIWVMLAGFKDVKEFTRSTAIIPSSFSFSEYIKTWNQLKFSRYYFNSLVLIIGAMISAVVFNGLLAYVLAILKPKGHKVVFALVMATMLIPPTTSIVAQYVNINNVLNWAAKLFQVDNYQTTILPMIPLWLIYGANAFWLILFKQFFEGLPREYFEAARIDGCSDLAIFTRIVLPLSKPILVVIAIFAATAAWSDFLLPNLVLGNGPWKTVMARLFDFKSTINVRPTDIVRAVVFSIVPPMILFAIFQKQITKGVAGGGIKG
ncbi:MAG: carbohydrate ABC transporter permease [Clostridiales bacterium]|nr:carbohydrate ABC transporter permease [Clostridiales bacterium]